MKDIKWSLPKQIGLFCGLALVTATAVWSIWSLTGVPLPILTYVQPDWARLLEASTPWKIYNPWILSRWYDVLFLPIWTLLVVLIVHFTKDKAPLINFGMANAFPIGAATVLLYPSLVFLGFASFMQLCEGNLIDFYSQLLPFIFSLKFLEMALYLYLFFCLAISLFISPIYFGLVISLLYGATFGFAAGLAIFILYFAPWYIVYYLIKFLIGFIKKMINRVKSKKNGK
ncbi:MAG: hypothetical protein V1765_01450 [bacterium]